MARLRFPGRPGHRFGRLGVRYGVDEPQKSLDPSTRFIANIHRSFKNFRELFGESDEEQEFEGFTDQDIKEVDDKIKNIEHQIAVEKEEIQQLSGKARVKSGEKLWTRPQALYRTMLKEGLGQPPKVSVSSRVLDAERQLQAKKDKEKLKRGAKDAAKDQTKDEKAGSSKQAGAFRNLKIKMPFSASKLKALKKKERLVKQKLKEKARLKKLKEKAQLKKLKEKAKLKKKKEKARAKLKMLKSRKVKTVTRRSLRKHDVETGAKNAGNTSSAEAPSQYALRSSPEKPSGKGISGNKVKSSTPEKPSTDTRRRGRPLKASNKVGVLPSSSRTVSTSKAKLILARAKQGRIGKQRPQIRQAKNSPKAREELQASSGNSCTKDKRAPAIKKQFVLPTQSSRSSRKIIPNKRLMDYDEGFDVPAKKMKVGTPTEAADSSQSGAPSLSSEPGEQQFQTPEQAASQGLLDRPLVVEGKRERKPSAKLIQKFSDEEIAQKLETRHKIEKLKQSKQEGEENEGASPAMGKKELARLEVEAEAAKRSGRNILQKAKFCLNQAAVNKSKAALARSLRRQMKKDQRKKGAVNFASDEPSSPPPVVSPTPGSAGVDPLSQGLSSAFGVQPLATLHGRHLVASAAAARPGMGKYGLAKGQKTAVFGQSGLPAIPKYALKTTTDKLPTFESTGQQALKTSASTSNKQDTTSKASVQKKRESRKSSATLECYVCKDANESQLYRHSGAREVVCRACQRFFFRRSVLKLKDRAAFICDNGGNCTIDSRIQNKTTTCMSCRYKKAAEIFPDPWTTPEILKAAGVKESDRKDHTKPLSPIRPSPPSGSGVKDKPKVKQKVEETPKGVHSKVKESAVPTPNDDALQVASTIPGAEEVKLVKDPAPVHLLNTTRVLSPPATSLKLDTLFPTTPPTSSPPMQFPSPRTKPTPTSIEVSPESTKSLEAEDLSEEAAGASGGHRPRIKHVCRRASVALGQRALFPGQPQLRLSALPSLEKEKLLQLEEQRPGSPDSDDMTLDEIIQHAKDEAEVVNPVGRRNVPRHSWVDLADDFDPEDEEDGDFHAHATVKKHKRPNSMGFVPKPGKHYKRKIRCKKCKGCLAQDCKKCVFCKDMIKYGGPGKMKQACKERKCISPMIPANPSCGKTAYMVHKKMSLLKAKSKEEQENQGSEEKGPPSLVVRPSEQLQEDLPTTKAPMSVEGESVRGYAASVLKKYKGAFASRGRLGSKFLLSEGKAANGQRALTKVNIPSPKKPDQSKQLKTGKFALQPLSKTKLLPTSEANHLIKADHSEKPSIEWAWKEGVAVVSSSPLCVRTVCLLCGSAGKHDLIFCNVCCEPFHNFCLDKKERPLADNLENWCCPRCQFCRVCGKRNNLLKCHKCHDTYHPDPSCLENYPTKPSKRRRIWICPKCVKCKSCGATRPGSHPEATWLYDFSLCFECGQLMDKGNFCPVCHKCYADDDWDSKMMQCSGCESWVHAKCEKLSDEMYEIMSYLPEDVMYHCPRCSKVRPAPWMRTIHQEMEAGIQLVIDALVENKKARILDPVKDKAREKLLRLQNPQRNRRSMFHLENPPSSSHTDVHNPSGRTGTEGKDGGNGQILCDNTQSEAASHGESGSTAHSPRSERSGSRTDSASSPPSFIPGSNSISPQDSGQISPATDSSPDVAMQVGNNDSSDAAQPTSSHERQQTMDQCVKTSTDNQTETEISKEDGHKQSSPITVTEKPSSSAAVPDSHVSPSVLNFQLKALSKQTERDSSSVKDTPLTVQTDASLESQTAARDSSKPPQEASLRSALDNIIASTASSRASSRAASPKIVETERPGEVSENTPETKKSSDPVNPGGAVEKNPKEQSADIKEMKHHVEFSDPAQEEKDKFPRDLKTVKKKQANKEYKTVRDFVEDVARILHYNMQEEQPGFRRKANNVIRAAFIKAMDHCFPWFNVKASNFWQNTKALPDGMLPDAVVPPSEDHTYHQWLLRAAPLLSPQPSPFKALTPQKEAALRARGLAEEDTRKCAFCGEVGDAASDVEGRMIYAGQDDWVHINCALWSAETYELEDGTLRNVHAAIIRGRRLKCDACGQVGPTVGCCHHSCSANFHFTCARKRGCCFMQDKQVYCNEHWYAGKGDGVKQEDFEVQRRSCVEVQGNKWIKKTWQKGLRPECINILIGSMTVENLGCIKPLSDGVSLLIPVDYCMSRLYWSTQDARRRCVYTCRITEIKPCLPPVMQVFTKNLTIVHDRMHPDYDAELERSFTTMVSPDSQRQRSLSTGSHNTSGTLSAFSSPTEGLTFVDGLPAVWSGISTGGLLAVGQLPHQVPRDPDDGVREEVRQLVQKYSEVTARKAQDALQVNTSTSKDLSSSWPSAQKSSGAHAPKVNLSSLSQNTLKLLGSAVEKYASSPDICQQTSHCVEDDNDLMLNEIADRLNAAAAKSKSRSRSRSRSREPSVERETGASKETTSNMETLTSPHQSSSNHPSSQKLWSPRVSQQPSLSDIVDEPSADMEEDFSAISQSTDGTNDEKPPNQAGEGRRRLRSHSLNREKPLKDNAPPTDGKKNLPLSTTTRRRMLCLNNLPTEASSEKSAFLPASGLQANSVGNSIRTSHKASSNHTPNHDSEKPMVVTRGTATVGDGAKVVQVSASGKEGLNPDISSLGFQTIKPQETPDSLTDAELSSSDYSDTDIDLRENYEYPDESSNESQVQRVKGQRPMADIASATSSLLPPEGNTPYNKSHPQMLKCRVSLTRVEQLPLHNKIAEKIKAESLARSSPSDQGPIKCYKCKRLYRTKESWQVHSETCNFEVSTSEDEEADEELLGGGSKGGTDQSKSGEKKVYSLRRRGTYVDTPSPVSQEPPIKRGRGRPPKVKPSGDVGAGSAKPSPAVVKDQSAECSPVIHVDLTGAVPTSEGTLRRGRSRKTEDTQTLKTQEVSTSTDGPEEQASGEGDNPTESRQQEPTETVQHPEDESAKATTDSSETKVSPILERYQRLVQTQTVDPMEKDTSDNVLGTIDVKTPEEGSKDTKPEPPGEGPAEMMETDREIVQPAVMPADTTVVVPTQKVDQAVEPGKDAPKDSGLTVTAPNGEMNQEEDDDLIIIDSDSCPSTPTKPAPSSEYTDIFIGDPNEKRTPPKQQKPSPTSQKQSPGETGSGEASKTLVGKGVEQAKMCGVRLPDGTTVKVIMSGQHMQNVKPEDLQNLILNSGLPLRPPQQQLQQQRQPTPLAPLKTAPVPLAPLKVAPAPLKTVSTHLKELRPKMPGQALQPRPQAGLVNLGATHQGGVVTVNPLGLQSALSPQAMMQASPPPTHLQAQVLGSPPRPPTPAAAAQIHNLSPPLVNSSSVLGLLQGRNPTPNQQTYSVSPDNQNLLCPVSAQALSLSQTQLATTQGGQIAYIVGQQPQAQLSSPGLLAGIQPAPGPPPGPRTMGFVDAVSSLACVQQQPALLPSMASGHTAMVSSPQGGITQMRMSVAIPSVAMTQPGLSAAPGIVSGTITQHRATSVSDSRPKFVGELLQQGRQQQLAAAAACRSSLALSPPKSSHQAIGKSVPQGSVASLVKRIPVSQMAGWPASLPATAKLKSLLTVKAQQGEAAAKAKAASISPGSKLENFTTIDLTKEPFIQTTSTQLRPVPTTPPQVRRLVSLSPEKAQNSAPLLKSPRQEEQVNTQHPKGIPSLSFYEGMVDKERSLPGALGKNLVMVKPTVTAQRLKLKATSSSPSKRPVPNLLVRKRKVDLISLQKLKKKVQVSREDYYRSMRAHLVQKKALRAKQDGHTVEGSTSAESIDPPRAKKLRKDSLSASIRVDPDLGEDLHHAPHPLIHPQHQHPSLPAPVVEEEVEDSPLSQPADSPPSPHTEGSIRRDEPYLQYEITSDDGFSVKASSLEEAWQSVVDSVQEARHNARLGQLSYTGLSGADMFGLTHSTVVYLLEQLYGAHTLRKYHFKYIHYDLDEDYEEEPALNPTGTARSEPFSSRKPYEMFSFLLSKYRPRPPKGTHAAFPDPKNVAAETAYVSSRRTTSLDLPMAMRFRRLREHAKEAVGVYVSPIHGRGLFCKRCIDAGEMVIEYAGEVIRSALTDSREKYYESKGIGCYMFRIDDHNVVDATVKGNAARFINHSCDPNCYSKVIDVCGSKHIVIFALKAIKAGEELTYDYKFPYEEVKIPCTCSAKRCRKYLN